MAVAVVAVVAGWERRLASSWLGPSQTLSEHFFSIDLLKKKQKSVAIENGCFQIFFNRNVMLAGEKSIDF